MSASRRGSTLAELVVALGLLTLVSAVCAAALLGAERYVRRALAQSDDRRAVRETEDILVAEMRAASAESLRLLGDTAVEFLGLVGSSVACVVSGQVLVLPPAVAAGGFPFSVWRVAPEAGDLVAAFDTSRADAWRTARVDSVASRADGAGCTPASGLLPVADSAARRAVTHVRLDRALGGGVYAGAPVRVLRRGRYVLFRGGDRAWSLAYRRCDAAGACGAAQPVTGALGSAADSGLTFTLVPSASRLDARLRAPFHQSGWRRETRLLHITLRNHDPVIP